MNKFKVKKVPGWNKYGIFKRVFWCFWVDTGVFTLSRSEADIICKVCNSELKYEF